MILSNGIISLEFDDRTGALCHLRDERTGIEHLANTTGGRLFHLLAPSPHWDTRYIDVRTQQCTLSQTGETVTLHYPRLVTADGVTLAISMEITVTLPSDSSEALFCMSIDNQSDGPISEVWFPIIGEWAGYAGPGHDLMTVGTGMTVPFDPHATAGPRSGATLLRMQHRKAFRFALATLLPWMDVSGDGRGLWLINYMREGHVGGFAIERADGYRKDAPQVFGWYCHPEIIKGTCWQSDPIGLGLHRGDWHDTARQYREWLRGWWQAADVPDRLRQMIGVQNVLFRGFDGYPVRPLEEIARVAEIGLKYGIRDLCVWDNLMLGTYCRLNPVGLTDYPAEEWETMRRGVADARNLGVTMSMLINQRTVGMQSDFWQSGGGQQAAMRLRDGSAKAESYPSGSFGAEMAPLWNGPQSAPMCPKAQEYRDEFDRQLDRLLDLGFDAYFLDQPYEDFPCFAKNHGHVTPDDTLQGIVEWVGSFRKRMRARYPESYIIGEMQDPFNGQVIDFGWNWFWVSSRPDIMAYSVPGPGMLNGYASDRDITLCQRAFLVGFLVMLCIDGLEGTLDDAPDFAAYVRMLAALREKTAHCTTCAQFEDTDGLTCEGAEAKRFSYADGDAVVIANLTDAPAQVQARVSSLGGTRRGRLFWLDGREDTLGEQHGDDARFSATLAPHDIVVWDLPYDE